MYTNSINIKNDKTNDFQNIPDVMKSYRNWLLWKSEYKDGCRKPAKIPYSIHGYRASVNDPKTWSSFDEVVQTYQYGGYSGIGFVFTNTPFVAMDIDGGLDKKTGEIMPEALEAINALQSYTELSQSGFGFHIIIEGRLPNGQRRKGAFEMYGDGSPSYFAMTGDVWGDYNEIRADQSAIDTVHQRFIEPHAVLQQKVIETSQVLPLSLSLSDTEIIERASRAANADKFVRLLNGDTSDYGGDDSAADLALCSLLAFWCNCDEVQIDRLFRKSGLMRTKWDEKRGINTYGNITIRTAINRCDNVYTGILCFVNAVVVSLASNGAFDAVTAEKTK